jgi:hypothetical protein
VLVLTEKDHSKDKRPDIKAAFGDFGSALIISLHDDGEIFGCEVAHAAHAKTPFSSVGKISIEDFQLGEGMVRGRLTTDGEVETFDQTWEVDLKFAVPFAGTAPDPNEKPATTDKPKPSEPKPDTNRPNVSKLNVHDLPFPKDATDIEYKQIVEHILFKSAANVQSLAGDLSKKLAEQGWAKDGSDLITPKSSILKRTRGEASLTIFVKPAGNGSQVTIFSEGLDWDEK